jgi:cytochrome bd-type quinol oxidase subunit 2
MKRRGSITFGILLILAGALFLAVELIPAFNEWYTQFANWPFWVVGPGLIFVFAAIISGVSALAIPGAIISGIGGILYYQQVNNDWQSWAYAWALIPGFVGVGIFIMHLLDGRVKKAFKEGGNLILTSAVMFLLFGSLMRSVFGQEPFFGQYWPVLIIIWGVWMLIKPLLRDSKGTKRVESDFEIKVDLDDVVKEEEIAVEVEEIAEETETTEEAEE